VVFADFSDANTVSFWSCTITGNSATYGVRLRQPVTCVQMIAIETDGVGSWQGTTVSLAVGARVATGRGIRRSRVVAISLLLSTRPVAAWSTSMITALATLTL